MIKTYRLSRSNLIALSIFLLISPALVFSQPKAEPKKNTPDTDFAYTSKDRRDPFEPLYLAKIKQARAGSALKEGYELEELRLVGVLKTSGARFAMMEDMQGKGLLFKKGDHLNKSTWILDIEDEKILVAHSVKGDIRKVVIDIPRR